MVTRIFDNIVECVKVTWRSFLGVRVPSFRDGEGPRHLAFSIGRNYFTKSEILGSIPAAFLRFHSIQ